MADEVDTSSIPFLLSEDVRVVNEGGRQTTALQDWFGALWSWMKRTVVDLSTKITTVEQTTGEISARVTEESIARATADEALAEHITTVEASAGFALAHGEIYFAAKANPTGATAAYGLYLTAGSSFAGFEAVAKSAGGSAIGLTADQFVFTDAGTLQPVFSYAGGGVWVLNGAIVVRSGTSGARLEITNEIVQVYDASNVLRVRLGLWT